MYDERGRRDKTTLPTGTIYKTDFDSLGRVVAEKVGTSDANLVQTTAYEYDGGGIGDGNLTEVTLDPGGSEAERVSQFFHDWRNRLVAAKSGVERAGVCSRRSPRVAATTGPALRSIHRPRGTRLRLVYKRGGR
jgi:YD repeat-containing protein